MKKIILFSAMLLFIVSCTEKDSEKEEPVIADFDAVLTGESPNAKIQLTNKSTGATSYRWNFDKGAADSVSTEHSPSTVNVDRAGSFIVRLTAINNNEKHSVSKTLTINGYNAIVTYPDLEFALDAGNTTYGRYFSFETGKMLKDTEINATNGSKIHLAFGSMEHTMYYFESPDKTNVPGLLNITGATHTKIINWQANPSISVASFDSMVDDRLLSGLIINGTNDSFGNQLPCTILFELADHRKGIIKAKAVNSARLLADIRIQKY